MDPIEFEPQKRFGTAHLKSKATLSEPRGSLKLEN
jgi:hypothetical protein